MAKRESPKPVYPPPSDKWITIRFIDDKGFTNYRRLRGSCITAYGALPEPDDRGHLSHIFFLGGPPDGLNVMNCDQELGRVVGDTVPT